jgi:hypothetical protein
MKYGEMLLNYQTVPLNDTVIEIIFGRWVMKVRVVHVRKYSGIHNKHI